mgnify:CR=1 FL=1
MAAIGVPLGLVVGIGGCAVTFAALDHGQHRRDIEERVPNGTVGAHAHIAQKPHVQLGIAVLCSLRPSEGRLPEKAGEIMLFDAWRTAGDGVEVGDPWSHRPDSAPSIHRPENRR